MMLEQSTNDFKSLIERMHLMKAYDDATREGDIFGGIYFILCRIAKFGGPIVNIILLEINTLHVIIKGPLSRGRIDMHELLYT